MFFKYLYSARYTIPKRCATHTRTRTQTHTQTDIQTDTQTDTQTDRQTDRQTHTHMCFRKTDTHVFIIFEGNTCFFKVFFFIVRKIQNRIGIYSIRTQHLDPEALGVVSIQEADTPCLSSQYLYFCTSILCHCTHTGS